MKFSGKELGHIQQVLFHDIHECTDLLESEMPHSRVEIIASRMENNRKLLERIDREFHARPEFRV